MAKKISEKEKKEILADYHTSQYSQRDLAKKYGISLGTVNKLTKTETPQNEQIFNAQVTILRANALLPSEQMNAVLNTAKDKIYNEGLVSNASQLALIRSMEQLSKGKKQVAVKVTDYSNGKPSGQSVEFVEMELESQDIKNHIEAIDKASLTLKVNKRHSQSSVEVNNQNVQENKKIEIVVD